MPIVVVAAPFATITSLWLGELVDYSWKINRSTNLTIVARCLLRAALYNRQLEAADSTAQYRLTSPMDGNLPGLSRADAADAILANPTTDAGYELISGSGYVPHRAISPCGPEACVGRNLGVENPPIANNR